jgi:methylmalonyl-CoA/ethylmalonyl-CoA epimerase
VAYRVPDLPAALRSLAEQGIELIDREPRPGARGHRVAFLHPRSTGGVLIELLEE